MDWGPHAVKLFLGSLAVYLIVVLLSQGDWFISDEGFYGMSIYEAIKTGIKPYITYYGTPAFWKPFLMVDVYAIIAGPLIQLMPYNTAFRVPSAIFSAISTVLAYTIARKLLNDERKALFSALLFGLSPVVMLYGTKIFIEAMAVTFVLGSVLSSVMLCENERPRLVWAALLVLCIVCASFSKSATIGIMCVGLSLMYAFIFKREALGYITGACAVAAVAVLGLPLLTDFPDGFYRMYAEDFFTRRMGFLFGENIISTGALLLHLLPVFIIGAKGFSLRDRAQVFLALWAAPLAIIAFTTLYAWYSYYFMPAIAMLAISLIPLDRTDTLVMMGLLVLGIVTFMYSNMHTVANSEELKLTGYIAENIGKDECTLFVGVLLPTVHSYLEINGYGHNSVYTNPRCSIGTEEFLNANITPEQLGSLVYGYNDAGFVKPLSEFDYLFLRWEGIDTDYFFRTEKQCTRFDYVIITDYDKQYDLSPYYDLDYETTQFRVWKLNGRRG